MYNLILGIFHYVMINVMLVYHPCCLSLYIDFTPLEVNLHVAHGQ